MLTIQYHCLKSVALFYDSYRLHKETNIPEFTTSFYFTGSELNRLVQCSKDFTKLFSVVFLLCWGLMTCQPLWVILCHLPEKGRKETEETVEEIRTGKKQEWKWRNKNIPPLPLPATRKVSLAQLQASISWTTQWNKTYDTFATSTHSPSPIEREKR